ncbi:MAG TPA: glycine cleavage system aminomethyltransferase GcvT [Myxococcota bacterium]|nr:glycine cleavage system aminomethyltransferase GcvT [Myxococcota bacterium]
MSALRRTPLIEVHRALGARLVPFAGFEMPVQYRSILEEHAAVRERAGLFDVSHMGQLWLRGESAIADAERLLTCPVASLKLGRVRYGLLCNERGGVVDDVTLYRIATDQLLICVNASNIAKDRAWIAAHCSPATELQDASDETCLLALQGPASDAILAPLVAADLARVRFFAFTETELAGTPVLVSRTGYTHAGGFEIYGPAGDAEKLWRTISAAGEAHGLAPAGLGARDTLRLEAALPLYGHELDDDTSPLEARLERFVKLDHGGFIGADALRAQRAAGLRRALAGFVVEGRGIARAEHELAHAGAVVGRVTSGAPSPTLGKPIGLGYVPPPLAAIGTKLDVMVRGQAVPARVVETPFVRGPG